MDLNWHKSSYSNQQGGDCVEVAELPHTVLVRDTQNRELDQLGFSAQAWAVFLQNAKTGRL